MDKYDVFGNKKANEYAELAKLVKVADKAMTEAMDYANEHALMFSWNGLDYFPKIDREDLDNLSEDTYVPDWWGGEAAWVSSSDYC